MIKNEAPALLRYADCAGVAHSYNGWSLLPSGDIWVTNRRARATGRQSRDLTPARVAFQPQDTKGASRGMALRGMAGQSTLEQFATPYGGLCEQREDAHEAQDDDDPNNGGGDGREVATKDGRP
jgi:hypothetical protein